MTNLFHCVDPGCSEPTFSRGLCKQHYLQWLADPDNSTKPLPKHSKANHEPYYNYYDRKFDNDQIRAIRELAASNVPGAEIARRYGSNPSTIYSILHNRTYKDIS